MVYLHLKRRVSDTIFDTKINCPPPGRLVTCLPAPKSGDTEEEERKMDRRVGTNEGEHSAAQLSAALAASVLVEQQIFWSWHRTAS